MNGKSVGFLGFAVILGLVAMLVSRLLLGSRTSNDNETLDVLVANRDLKEEELLKLDMVKVTKIARSAVPPGAFASFKEVEDRWIRTAMLEGDPIIEKKLGPRGPAGTGRQHSPGHAGIRARRDRTVECLGLHPAGAPRERDSLRAVREARAARRDDSPERPGPCRGPDLHSEGGKNRAIPHRDAGALPSRSHHRRRGSRQGESLALAARRE